MKNFTKQYIKECKSILPVYSKDEKKFIQRLQQNIYLFESSNPNASYEEIKAHFGDPADVIMAYYQSIDMTQLYAKIYKRKIIKRLIIFIVIVLLFTSCIFSYTLYKEYEDFHNAIPNMTSEEIEIIQ